MNTQQHMPLKNILSCFGIVLALLSFALVAIPAAETQASAEILQNAAPVLKPLSHPDVASATTWHALPNQGLDDSVRALAVSGGDLYVGGMFNQTGDGTLTDLDNITHYDTTTDAWHALPNRVANHVHALAVVGSDLYAGGTYMSSNDLSSIARYDTTAGVWHALPNQGLNGNVIALAVSGSDLYVGGGFTQTGDGTLTNLGGIARYDTLAGTWHALPNQGLDNLVRALAVVDSNLYVGGKFTQTGDRTLANLGNIVRYNTTAHLWHVLPNQGLDSTVQDLVASGGDLYVGGSFTQTGDGTLTNLGHIAHYETLAGDWYALPNQGLEGTVYALAASGSDLYMGGYFTQTGDGTLTDLGNIARYDTTAGVWHTLSNQGFDNTVLALAVSNSQLYAGGYLTQTGDGSLTNLGNIVRKELFPEITVSPGGLAFGDQGLDAGPTPSQMVTITNDGTADLHISSFSLTGADAAEFAIESDSGQTTLAPGASRTIQVSFDPSSTGTKSAALSITSDDTDEPTVNVTLSGNGHSGDNLCAIYLPLVFNNE